MPKRGTRNLGVDKGKQREVVEDDGEEEDEEEEEQGDMRSRKRRKRVHDYDFLAPALDASIPSSVRPLSRSYTLVYLTVCCRTS